MIEDGIKIIDFRLKLASSNMYVEQLDSDPEDVEVQNKEVSENVKNKIIKFEFQFMDPMDLSRATTPDHGTPNDEMNRSRTEAAEP